MKLSNKKAWFLGAAALATLGFTGLFAHASSNAPAADTLDHLFPNNSISIGSSPTTAFTVPAGVTGAPTVTCTHNIAVTKTPNTKAGSTAPQTLQVLPPAFDKGPAGAATPAPCTDQFSNTYVTVTSGAWSGVAYDCPTAVTTCTEGAETALDAFIVKVPHDGAVLTSSNGCTIKVNDKSTGSVPINVPATYNQTNGQLKVNVTSTTAGIPVTIVQTAGGPTCPLVTPGSATCAGQTTSVCSSFVGTYTFGGTTGFPKFTDN